MVQPSLLSLSMDPRGAHWKRKVWTRKKCQTRFVNPGMIRNAWRHSISWKIIKSIAEGYSAIHSLLHIILLESPSTGSKISSTVDQDKECKMYKKCRRKNVKYKRKYKYIEDILKIKERTIVGKSHPIIYLSYLWSYPRDPPVDQ